MHNSTIVFLINDDVRAIKATYQDGESPKVFKTLDQTIAIDDLLVVQSGTRHEFTVVKAVEVDVEPNFDSNFDVPWIVSKVHLDELNKVLGLEKTAIATVQKAERQRKKEELRASVFASHDAEIKTLALSKIGDDESVTE